MPKGIGYPDKTKSPENPGKENFLGTTTPETAEGLINDLEGGNQVGQEQQVQIPLSIAPHLQGVEPGAQTELHIVATVGAVQGDNVTLNISKAFEMKEPPQTATQPQVQDPGAITQA